MTKDELKNEIAIVYSNSIAWVVEHPWPVTVVAALMVGFILGKMIHF